MTAVYLILCAIVLGWLSIQDVKTMQVHPFGMVLLAAINVWYVLMTHQFVSHIIAASIAFILLSIIANLTKQQLGMGDVYIVAILFLGIGAEPAMRLLLISAFCVVLWAIIMRFVTRTRNDVIACCNVPFLPFISLSFVVTNLF